MQQTNVTTRDLVDQILHTADNSKMDTVIQPAFRAEHFDKIEEVVIGIPDERAGDRRRPEDRRLNKLLFERDRRRARDRRASSGGWNWRFWES